MNSLTNTLKHAVELLNGRICLLHLETCHKGLETAIKESSLNIIPSSDGEIATVYESSDAIDYSHQTTSFDLHKDGLYYPTLPHFLLLFCENPGRGDTPTTAIDTRPVVEHIENRPELHILLDVDLVYVGKNGDEHARPLIDIHPLSGDHVLNLAARGYLRPRRKREQATAAVTLREMAVAMTTVFGLLDSAVSIKHFWKEGDVLLIDNNAFVHGREARGPDPQRKLLRVWLSAPSGGRR